MKSLRQDKKIAKYELNPEAKILLWPKGAIETKVTMCKATYVRPVLGHCQHCS